MKNFRTFLMLTSLVFGAQVYAQDSAVIDLKTEGKEFLGLSNKYLKTIETGEGISFSFNDQRPHYVERLLISAIGMQSQFSFVKVYADGDEVATLGVPGRDPEYPIVIRGNVTNITLRAQDNSKVKILDFKIFTERKEYSAYSTRSPRERSSYDMSQWGGKILDLSLEIEYLRKVDTKISEDDLQKHILPLKKLAFKLQAATNARDLRSLNTRAKALSLVKEIDLALDLLEGDSFLLDQRYNGLILDLETIKQDIGEKYDIKVD